MGVMWLSEAIPISVTALFPVFLFPMLGLATGKHAVGRYEIYRSQIANDLLPYM
jgi:sodium-dependent dicarboxylate transporter 2/3/5